VCAKSCGVDQCVSAERCRRHYPVFVSYCLVAANQVTEVGLAEYLWDSLWRFSFAMMGNMWIWSCYALSFIIIGPCSFDIGVCKDCGSLGGDSMCFGRTWSVYVFISEAGIFSEMYKPCLNMYIYIYIYIRIYIYIYIISPDRIFSKYN